MPSTDETTERKKQEIMAFLHTHVFDGASQWGFASGASPGSGLVIGVRPV